MSTHSPKPTIVFVHGAWADTSSWDGEVSALQAKGYDARAIANPLQSLTTDADTVKHGRRRRPRRRRDEHQPHRRRVRARQRHPSANCTTR